MGIKSGYLATVLAMGLVAAGCGDGVASAGECADQVVEVLLAQWPNEDVEKFRALAAVRGANHCDTVLRCLEGATDLEDEFEYCLEPVGGCDNASACPGGGGPAPEPCGSAACEWTGPESYECECGSGDTCKGTSGAGRLDCSIGSNCCPDESML